MALICVLIENYSKMNLNETETGSLVRPLVEFKGIL